MHTLYHLLIDYNFTTTDNVARSIYGHIEIHLKVEIRHAVKIQNLRIFNTKVFMFYALLMNNHHYYLLMW